jgi:imidazolonepropionase-like amidohydrolase
MMKNHKGKHSGILVIIFLLISMPVQSQAKQDVLVIKGGKIHTVSGGVISDGIIVLKDGKIQSVGYDATIPAGAAVIEANGLVVTPGIIDARSSFGVSPPREGRRYFVPERKIIDYFTPVVDSAWLKCGVTATYVTPSQYDLLGGFGAVVKLVGNKEEATVHEEAGMSVSFGESTMRGGNMPTTRQGRVGRLRQEFIRAQEYQKLLENGKIKEGAESAEFESIIKVLKREVPLRFFVNNPDDIMTALRFAQEFDLKLVIDSGAAAHRVASILFDSNVPVVVGPSIMGLGSGGPFEMFAHTPENAGRLHKAGVKVALSTDSRWGRSILSEGVVAKSHGLPEDAALRAVTLHPAEILEVADRMGSIEPGKDADIVLWKEHPLNTWGEAQKVIVNGKIVFDRKK